VLPFGEEEVCAGEVLDPLVVARYLDKAVLHDPVHDEIIVQEVPEVPDKCPRVYIASTELNLYGTDYSGG
jgi:hypothetical protein